MQHSKRYEAAAEKVDHEELLHRRRGHRQGEGPRHGEVRRDRRAGGPARGRPPQGRPDRPRDAVAARRHRQDRARRSPSRRARLAVEAREAGADEVGADELVAKIRGGFLDFDVAISTPDLMGQVGTLGRVLGPRGLMPNPKTGTVTTEVGKAVGEFKAGRVEYRTDKVGNVHLRVGKVSFDRADLVAQRPRRDRGAGEGEARVGEGPLHRLGDGLLDHGPRGQDRPAARPRAGRGARAAPDDLELVTLVQLGSHGPRPRSRATNATTPKTSGAVRR